MARYLAHAPRRLGDATEEAYAGVSEMRARLLERWPMPAELVPIARRVRRRCWELEDDLRTLRRGLEPWIAEADGRTLPPAA